MKEFRNFNFFKNTVLPAFLLFVIPVFSLWFYNHATNRFDSRSFEGMRAAIAAANDLTAVQKAETIQHFTEWPVSRILQSSDPEIVAFALQIPESLKNDYWMFRKFIEISFGCIVSGILMFIPMGISVYFSSISQRAQYLSLAVGWRVMQVFLSLQAIAQSILVVSLSYWMTGLWAKAYYVKLIGIAVMLALATLAGIFQAIFRKRSAPMPIEGKLIDRATAPELWCDLERLCKQVGTDLPDQIVGGIDENFYVTESPVVVGTEILNGRTLFISLSLIRIMPAAEVEAVLAHELAHFSGSDTYYSKKISPILAGYDHYLRALHEGVLGLLVYPFAALFPILYEANLRKLSRDREFRADRIAAVCTSPQAIVSSLLHIVSFSEYHTRIEKEIFESQQTDANLVQHINTGFQSFVETRSTQRDWSEVVTPHPFDSHPTLNLRAESLGLELNQAFVDESFSHTTDETWYRKIQGVETLENELWSAYQERFRNYHELALVYRYLPETEAERAVVEAAFPAHKFALPKDAHVVIDCEKVTCTEWPSPVPWSEIGHMVPEKDFMGREYIKLSLTSDGPVFHKLPLPRKSEVREQLGNVLRTTTTDTGPP